MQSNDNSYLKKFKNRNTYKRNSISNLINPDSIWFKWENKLKKKAVATYLVCPPFDNSLTGEDLVGGFKLKSDLSLLEENSKNTHLFFSEDDDVVPVSHAEKYKKKLKNANIVIFKSKNGHFNISTFPEIVKIIKDDFLN